MTSPAIPTKQALVTGANEFIGQHLCRSLPDGPMLL